jgi:hypothetical protein
MKEKYSTVTFAYMDKVGKLDEIENPEAKVFNSFVTRVHLEICLGTVLGSSAFELVLQMGNRNYLNITNKPTSIF